MGTIDSIGMRWTMRQVNWKGLSCRAHSSEWSTIRGIRRSLEGAEDQQVDQSTYAKRQNEER